MLKKKKCHQYLLCHCLIKEFCISARFNIMLELTNALQKSIKVNPKMDDLLLKSL